MRKVRKIVAKIAEMKPADIKDGTFLEGMHNKTGTCRFCGQMRVMTYLSDSVSQEQVDMDATRTCTCKEAYDHARLEEAAENAKSNIRTLNKQLRICFSEAIEKQCDGLIDLIAAGDVKSATIKLDEVKTIYIKKKGDSKINVSIRKNTKWDLDS